MTENKFGKYLMYAVGEIILVVLGILIALQINNWNEHQKELKQEKVLMFTLHNAFTKNNKLLNKHRIQYQEVKESNIINPYINGRFTTVTFGFGKSY